MRQYTRNASAPAIVMLLLPFSLCPCLADDEVAADEAAQALLLACGAAIEQEDLDALAQLHWKPDELKRAINERWSPLFGRYEAIRASHEVLLCGWSDDRALVRYRYRVTGVKARSRDRRRYVLRAGIYDTLLARTEQGWRFTERDWPQPDVESQVNDVIGAAASLPAPCILQLVFQRRGARWVPVRPFVWYGLAAPSDAPTKWPGGAKVVPTMLEAWANRQEAGTLSVFLQKPPQRRAASADAWTALEPVWTEAKGQNERERALEAARRRMEHAFGDPNAHEAYGKALADAEELRLAMEEYDKACALAPTHARRKALMRLADELSHVHAAQQWKVEADARRAARLRRDQVRAESDRSALALHKPPNVVLNDAFVLRFHLGDPTVNLAMAALEEANRRINSLFGVPMRPVEVNIFASKAEYLAFRRFRGETWVPEWSGGTSGADGILTFSQPEVRRTILHEYGHEAVNYFTNGVTTPIWLDEGIATAIEGVPENYEEFVEEIAASGRALDMQQLGDDWRRLPADSAGLAYAQSRSMVEFLAARVGREGLLELLQDLRSGMPAEAAFLRRTGMTQADFQRQWLADVLRRARTAGARTPSHP